jgi:hypothetical protein
VRVDAGGLLPIVRAWWISIAPSRQSNIGSRASQDSGAKSNMIALTDPPQRKLSLQLDRARNLFGRF